MKEIISINIAQKHLFLRLTNKIFSNKKISSII